MKVNHKVFLIMKHKSMINKLMLIIKRVALIRKLIIHPLKTHHLIVQKILLIDHQGHQT